MAITHKFDNAYTITDYTTEMNIIPNKWDMIGKSGLFVPESVATNTFTFDKTYGTVELAQDTPWAERSRFSGNRKSEMHSFTIPHFTLDDTVTVGDVWNKRKIGTADQQETKENVLMQKMEQLNGSWDITLEYAMCQAIQGNKYAPNNATIDSSVSWYTEFGQTQEVRKFDLIGGSISIKDSVNKVVQYIQDSWKAGGVLEEVTFYCTPKFFQNLIEAPEVEMAYQYYASTQEPLRKSLREGMHRRFEWQDVTFIEYRGKTPKGEEMFPETVGAGGQAWAVPSGSNGFHIKYAPAYRLDELGTAGASRYMWTHENRSSSQIEVWTESNFLTMNSRPELVVLCEGAAP